MGDMALLLAVRASADQFLNCVQEFPDDPSVCAECAQNLEDSLFESRKIEPELLGYFTEEDGQGHICQA